MPTETFDNNAFLLFNILGESQPGQPQCIQLDLSTTDVNQPPNQFNLSNLNNPNSQCNQVLTAFIPDPNKRAQFIAEINKILSPITIPIPEFDVPGYGSVRLSHLVMQSMDLGWSAADSGSILVFVRLNELPGQHDIQGSNCYGDLTNAELKIYLPVSVNSLDCRGQPVVPSVAATFDMNISLYTNDGVPVPDFLIPKGQIRDTITNTVQSQLLATDQGQTENRASLLLQAVLASLYKPNSPMPPPKTVFYNLAVGDNTATISWADTVRYATVTVEGVQGPAPGGLPALLVLGAGYDVQILPFRHGANYCVATGFAPPGLPLSVSVSAVPLPDGKALDVSIGLYSVFPPRTICGITRTFTSPTYGAGAHTDQCDQFVATYHIDVT